MSIRLLSAFTALALLCGCAEETTDTTDVSETTETTETTDTTDSTDTTESTDDTDSSDTTDDSDTTDTDETDTTDTDDSSEVSYASSVSSGDITFYFAQEYPTGQFVDGQWWVHNNGDEVTITAMSPASYDDGGRVRNGAELNPTNSSSQGFDGLGDTGTSVDMSYSSSKNVDPGATGESLVVEAGNSIVKAISREEDERRPLLDQAAILTVLDTSPADDAFRPAYVGDDKSIIAELSDLNFEALGKYEPLSTTPHISEYVASIEGVWLDHNTEWTQRDIHPESSMPVYGREIAKLTAEVGLQLQLNYTDAEKEDALVAMVQYGIDIYGILQNQGLYDGYDYYWYNNGGHNQGRKLPLLLAGMVLNHSGMLAAANAEQDDNRLFHEDQQTFYVSQANIDDGTGGYDQDDLGLADWATRAWDRSSTLDADWGSSYRTVNGNASVVTALAVRMMGATDDWNRDAFFDYADRYFSIEGGETTDSLYGNEISETAADLWNAYRDQLGTNNF